MKTTVTASQTAYWKTLIKSFKQSCGGTGTAKLPLHIKNKLGGGVQAESMTKELILFLHKRSVLFMTKADTFIIIIAVWCLWQGQLIKTSGETIRKVTENEPVNQLFYVSKLLFLIK